MTPEIEILEEEIRNLKKQLNQKEVQLELLRDEYCRHTNIVPGGEGWICFHCGKLMINGTVQFDIPDLS